MITNAWPMTCTVPVSTGAAMTVRPVDPVMPSNVADSVTAPGLTAVASPLLLIVACAVSEEFQFASVVRLSVVPSENVPVAVNCWVNPVARLVLAGVTVIDCKATLLTVNVTAPALLVAAGADVFGPVAVTL